MEYRKTNNFRESRMYNSDSGETGVTIKGILILVLLLVGAGAGGYFFATQQKFAPIKTVTSGTPGAIAQQEAQAATSVSTPLFGSTVKNKYWISSRGNYRVGYAITVFVNGQRAGQFSEPDRKLEISRFVKPGENQITFVAKHLPDGMIENKGASYRWLTLEVKSGNSLQSFSHDVSTLLSYKRTAAEDSDYNDQLSFITLE